jgi:hypothetical protein
MPFVWDPEEWWQRPTKRRKIHSFEVDDMARRDGWEPSPPPRREEEVSYPSTDPDPKPHSPPPRTEVWTSDREELIQCIKRGERPTWVPKPNLEALCAEADAQAEGLNANDSLSQPRHDTQPPSPPSPTQMRLPTPPQDPIPRPPSALHSGDFYEPSSADSRHHHLPLPAHRPLDPRHASPPSWTLESPIFPRTTSHPIAPTLATMARARAPSLGSSLSSSFVMRAPTSPLVHATSSPGLDSVDADIQAKSSRRRTLPPQSFQSMSFTGINTASSSPTPALRREVSMPHQSHHSRRSLTLFTYQPASSAQGVFPNRHRRLSQASDVSPVSRKSMVGSFEESILRGRMSTPPSKPLDFVAQIGVLGRGDCPPSLKCPAHVSVPFPAVFYNYASTPMARSLVEDSPSPYVGTIDLDHHLKPIEEVSKRRKRLQTNDPDILMAQITGPENTSIGRALAKQEEAKQPPKILLDGAYRVPQQGQLQVIIKNPNKTAVKLFLIPYDLEGMEPGNKTFVRQRSFSSGPIVENVVSTKPIQDPLSNKRMLRYLIHLKFCCLSKGRYYLYDNIRVVFANRVPEGKEKLRNEIQLPEPKFSPFVPGSRSRRPSIATPPSPSFADAFETPGQNTNTSDPGTLFAEAIPFKLGRSLPQEGVREEAEVVQSIGFTDIDRGLNMSSMDITEARPKSPEVHGFDRISTSQRGSPVPWSPTLDLAGRRSPSPALMHGDGLLSRKLRELGVRNGHGSGQELGHGGSRDEEKDE